MHWWYRGMRVITHGLIQGAFRDRHDLHILDAGCGAGGNLDWLAKFGTAYGMDYSPLALNYAAGRHAGQLARASVDRLPYAENTFDLIVSFDVLCCREVGDDVGALAEFARVLRPGGMMLIRLPALPSLRGPHDDVVHGVRRYTSAELSAKLSRAGLFPLRITYANTLLLPLIYLARRGQSLLQRLSGPPDLHAPSDVRPTPGLLNDGLVQLLRAESAWINSGYALPLGVSVMALAQKVVNEL